MYSHDHSHSLPRGSSFTPPRSKIFPASRCACPPPSGAQALIRSLGSRAPLPSPSLLLRCQEALNQPGTHIALLIFWCPNRMFASFHCPPISQHHRATPGSYTMQQGLTFTAAARPSLCLLDVSLFCSYALGRRYFLRRVAGPSNARPVSTDPGTRVHNVSQ